MRTLFSATVFFLSFFLLGDSRAPEVAPAAAPSLVSVVIAGPMAELCSPSPQAIVVVLMPGGGGVWPVDAALRRSLDLTLETEDPRAEVEAPWWSLERTVTSRLSELAADLIPDSGPLATTRSESATDPLRPRPGGAFPLEGPI
jgi:hypothetical protein